MNREYSRKYYKEYMRKIRMKALSMLSEGGEIKCRQCGVNDIRALQIDHIDGRGNSDRKTRQATRLHLDIVRGRNSSNVQILCANCNWIKRHENQEVAGRPRVHNSVELNLFTEDL